MWIWLYWISFLQWTWSAIMLNEFEGEEYSDHCADGGGGLKSFLATMPLSPRQTRAVELYEFSRRPGDCEAVLGDSVLGSFELGGRDKWKCLGVRGVFHPGAHRAVLLRRPVRATREALISLSSE